jgi:predicted aspartyl protease
MKSLTIVAKGRRNVLRSQVSISRAFDPTKNEDQPFSTFDALWDTGATMTAINQRVADTLGLKPITRTRVQTAGGVRRQDVYLINLQLPNGAIFSHVLVNGSDFGAVDVDALIGIDIIASGQLIIMNHEGDTLMTFNCPASTNILTACHGIEAYSSK